MSQSASKAKGLRALRKTVAQILRGSYKKFAAGAKTQALIKKVLGPETKGKEIPDTIREASGEDVELQPKEKMRSSH